MTQGIRSYRGKRMLDIVASLCALLALIPVYCIIGMLIALRMGRPILFRQTRIGAKGRAFELIKFRTMSDCRDRAGKPLDDSKRLTPLGKFLRSTSLDEIPEFWNVLKGDMSLVGPRPLLPEYVELYTPEQFRRHDVRPGLTGLCQVEGRNQLGWAEKFALDVAYVDRVSFALDVKILFRTLLAVLTGKGVSAEGYATMPRFEGTPQGSDARARNPNRGQVSE